jgi:hypothetical protein
MTIAITGQAHVWLGGPTVLASRPRGAAFEAILCKVVDDDFWLMFYWHEKERERRRLRLRDNEAQWENNVPVRVDL